VASLSDAATKVWRLDPLSSSVAAAALVGSCAGAYACAIPTSVRRLLPLRPVSEDRDDAPSFALGPMSSNTMLAFPLALASRARRLLFVVVPFASIGAQATGTVTGRVTSTAGDAIQGAAVVVTGTSRGAITRSDGTYRIVLPAGRYEFRARLLGYASAADSVSVADGQTVTKNFSLNRAVTNLEAVAVVGTRTGERSVVSAPVPIDVISSIDVQQQCEEETVFRIRHITAAADDLLDVASMFEDFVQSFRLRSMPTRHDLKKRFESRGRTFEAE